MKSKEDFWGSIQEVKFRVKKELQWATSNKRYISNFRIKKYRNKYVGKRCFIIGNGPSINKTNLSLLKNEYTFGLNRIYLLFDKYDFHPTFFVSVNRLVTEQFSKEIEALDMPKFVRWEYRKKLNFSNSMIMLKGTNDEIFSKNAGKIISIGGTVTYVAMQLAFYMGFSKVILVGVDHSFSSKGPPNKEILSNQDDPNHFDPNYFGKGLKWNLPDLETSEKSYRLAKEYFEAGGREILDATIDGKLNVFQKVDYDSLW